MIRSQGSPERGCFVGRWWSGLPRNYDGGVPAHVVRISIAPVKSLGLVHPEEVVLERGGVRGNRRFWLADKDGRRFHNKPNGPTARRHTGRDEGTRLLPVAFPGRPG